MLHAFDPATSPAPAGGENFDQVFLLEIINSICYGHVMLPCAQYVGPHLIEAAAGTLSQGVLRLTSASYHLDSAEMPPYGKQ